MNKEQFCLLLKNLKQEMIEQLRVTAHLKTHCNVDMRVFVQDRLANTVANILEETLLDKGVLEWFLLEVPTVAYYKSPLNGHEYKIETAEDVWNYNQLFIEKEV